MACHHRSVLPHFHKMPSARWPSPALLPHHPMNCSAHSSAVFHAHHQHSSLTFILPWKHFVKAGIFPLKRMSVFYSPYYDQPPHELMERTFRISRTSSTGFCEGWGDKRNGHWLLSVRVSRTANQLIEPVYLGVYGSYRILAKEKHF